MAIPQFHSLSVAKVRKLTDDAMAVHLKVPLDLQETYRFTQGQFVTLRTQIDGEELRRSYSVCCAVSEYTARSEIVVGIKAIPGGRFSNWVKDNLRAGHSVDTLPPDGRFFIPLDPSQARRYLAFAGGSGITPILSLIKTTLEEEPHSRFTLFYGNRTVSGVMFAEELSALKNRYLGRLSIYHIISDEPQEIDLYEGVLNKAKCVELLESLAIPALLSGVFVCGPAMMMDAAESALAEVGVPSRHIRIERFGTPLPSAVASNKSGLSAQPASVSAGKMAQVSLIVGGKTRRLSIPYQGQSVLDCGLAAGLDLPYACKGGVCCTCRARVLEGKVVMDRNYTLEQQEIDRGFVLSCQAHPVTESLVISYDER